MTDPRFATIRRALENAQFRTAVATTALEKIAGETMKSRRSNSGVNKLVYGLAAEALARITEEDRPHRVSECPVCATRSERRVAVCGGALIGSFTPIPTIPPTTFPDEATRRIHVHCPECGLLGTHAGTCAWSQLPNPTTGPQARAALAGEDAP